MNSRKLSRSGKVLAFVLALGAYNKTTVTARLRTAPEAGQRALRLTLSLDAFIFFVVLGAVTAAVSRVFGLFGGPADRSGFG